MGGDVSIHVGDVKEGKPQVMILRGPTHVQFYLQY